MNFKGSRNSKGSGRADLGTQGGIWCPWYDPSCRELSPLHSTGVSGGSASAIPNARLCSGSPRLWSQALSHPWTLSQLWLLPP